jgi:hypothetical protein
MAVLPTRTATRRPGTFDLVTWSACHQAGQGVHGAINDELGRLAIGGAHGASRPGQVKAIARTLLDHEELNRNADATSEIRIFTPLAVQRSHRFLARRGK